MLDHPLDFTEKVSIHLAKDSDREMSRSFQIWLAVNAPEKAFRMNLAKIAQELNVPKQALLTVALAGVKTGLLDLRWEYHCPHCNGVPDFHSHLREVKGASYCPMCTLEFKNVLDKNIEVSFSPSPSFIKIPEKTIEYENEKTLALLKKGEYKMPDPFLSGLDCLQNPYFREYFSDDVLSSDESLEIRSLSFMFTDIKGSTELYDKLGDAKAYTLVRDHFRILFTTVESKGGVVVKTIGDAIMASFETAQQAFAAAAEMRQRIKQVVIPGTESPLEIKIGLHTGPAIAVTLNDRLDYFGQTVNLAARIQGLANSDEIFFSEALVQTGGLLEELKKAKKDEPGLKLRRFSTRLKGVAERQEVYSLS